MSLILPLVFNTLALLPMSDQSKLCKLLNSLICGKMMFVSVQKSYLLEKRWSHENDICWKKANGEENLPHFWEMA